MQPTEPTEPTLPQHPRQSLPPAGAPAAGFSIGGKRLTLPWIIGIVVALLVVVTCGCCGTIALASNLNKPTAQATATTGSHSTPVPRATATHGPTNAYTYLCALWRWHLPSCKDIQPGTYRTRAGSSGCYYERLKGFDGTVDDIIANNDTDAPAVVTISPTDKGFSSADCGPGRKICRK